MSLDNTPTTISGYTNADTVNTAAASNLPENGAGAASGGNAAKNLRAVAALMGGVSKFSSSLNTGAAQEKAGQANVAALENEAERQTRLGQQEKNASRRQDETLAGKRKAAFGASGVSSSSGSPLSVLDSTYATQEQDANRIKWTSDLAAQQLQNQIASTRIKAQNEAHRSYASGLDSLLSSTSDLSKLFS
jgi:hypothetical protein